jgi:hypothetical protein
LIPVGIAATLLEIGMVALMIAANIYAASSGRAELPRWLRSTLPASAALLIVPALIGANWRPLLLLAVVVAVPLGFVWRAVVRPQTRDTQGSAQGHDFWAGYTNSIMGAITIIAGLIVIYTAASLNLVMLVIPNIPWAVYYEGGPGTFDTSGASLITQVQSAYLFYSQMTLVVLFSILTVYGLIAVAAPLLISVLERRRPREIAIVAEASPA